MTEPEPDPFKNARGLNGMLSQKGPPLWPFLLAALGIGGVVALRMHLASTEAASRDALFELDRRLASERATPSILAGGGTTAPTLDEVTAKSRKLCAKLASCNGAAPTDPIVGDCVSKNVALAQDDLSRSMLATMLDDLSRACGDKTCPEFADCYFDRIKTASEGALGPARPVSAPDRARMKELVCKVALETPGRLPDLGSPNASPEAKELGAMLDEVGPAAASDIMKEATAECAPGGAPSAGATRGPGGSRAASATR
jgi:hypothetical protein